MKQPNNEDVEEIIEYQTLYSISITNMINKKINKSIEEANKIIEDKLYDFKKNEQGDIELNKDLYGLINNIKNKIYNMNKNEWSYYEDLIEETHKWLNSQNYKTKEKNRVGRPKKNKVPTLNQYSIDEFLIKTQEKEEDKKECKKMDIDH